MLHKRVCLCERPLMLHYTLLCACNIIISVDEVCSTRTNFPHTCADLFHLKIGTQNKYMPTIAVSDDILVILYLLLIVGCVHISAWLQLRSSVALTMSRSS